MTTRPPRAADVWSIDDLELDSLDALDLAVKVEEFVSELT